MYSNYIFDLYGTLIDINTDESSNEFWYKLSLFYSFKGAVYIAEELMTKIERTVAQLPETYRVAFEMSRYQDKTYKEIAQELNVSTKIVDYRIQQALKILRTELKDYLPLIAAIFPYFLFK